MLSKKCFINKHHKTKALAVAFLAGFSTLGVAEGETQLLWGDTHLHTSFSPDAYFLGNRSVDPHGAYRYAQGLPIVNAATGARVRIDRPLDFLLIADHAEMMGVPYRLFRGDPELAGTKTGQRFIKMVKEGRGADVFAEFLGDINAKRATPEFNSDRIRHSIWQETTRLADQYYQPGKFTTLVGWEWTSTPGGRNLHRVVMSPLSGKLASGFIPFSALDDETPEGLWGWLDKTSKQYQTDFISIPHNSNISGGLMFDTVDSEGRPLTADYARSRMRWEPVVEATQIKGDSETHPLLSPSDEFADFETYRHLLSATAEGLAPVTAGDYIRSALLRGLSFEQSLGVNPYKFALIGSSDAHTGQGAAEEHNFAGKVSIYGKPESYDRPVSSTNTTTVNGWDFSASGLAAVWAKDNTREEIFAAFKRKEVYATTGTRIALRVYAGWDFDRSDRDAKEIAAVGYRKGIPMGGDLSAAPEGKSPSFLIQAVRDPEGAKLDRVQVVKGYLDESGKAREDVYNVAVSSERQLDKQGKTSKVANTVDIAQASYQNSVGEDEFVLLWSDPDFKAEQRAFYYVRVLEIPTPRHTLMDAVAMGKDHPQRLASTIQERAYSSPIWYTP
ncbi:DUF3604 domain-containing protein [Pseudoteredinibacter isoporae]|uniref:DUF3604 domain-containing protein n=1 Tax=Pseudoteredinibacter isoporae TaxID=570281 RepID=UPI0033402680